MTNEQKCPYEPGDVIWYVFAMPGSDYVPRLVVSKTADGYIAYDPFLDEDVSVKWHPNTGHSIGDSGLYREATVPQGVKKKIDARAALAGISLHFATPNA
jgi:hypothetical protein